MIIGGKKTDLERLDRATKTSPTSPGLVSPVEEIGVTGENHLRQVCDFLWALQLPLPIKLTAMI
jgi:hypothetical protein